MIPLVQQTPPQRMPPFGFPIPEGETAREQLLNLLGLLFSTVGCASVLVVLLAGVLIVRMLTEPLKRIPGEHRKIEPLKVWLLLIPFFNLFWNFVVVTRISRSFQSYFDEQGREELGDCGYRLGVAFAVCAAATAFPYIGCGTGSVAVLLLVVYLIKIHDLKHLIPPADRTMGQHR